MTPKVILLTATLTYNLLLQDERPPGEGVVSPTHPHTPKAFLTHGSCCHPRLPGMFMLQGLLPTGSPY